MQTTSEKRAKDEENEEQNVGIIVQNFDIFTNNNEGFSKIIHNKNLPNFLRAMIIGPSGCGKSNVLLSLLLDKHGLKFRKIYFFGNTMAQEKYIFLQKIIEGIKDIQIEIFSNEKPIEPSNCLPYSLVIFDDVGTDSQHLAKSFFTMGRHFKLSVFFLSQSYCSVSKWHIRENSNYLILFACDELNLKHVFSEWMINKISFKRFSEICSQVWQKNFDFITINRVRTLQDYMLHKGFNIPIIK